MYGKLIKVTIGVGGTGGTPGAGGGGGGTNVWQLGVSSPSERAGTVITQCSNVGLSGNLGGNVGYGASSASGDGANGNNGMAIICLP